MNLVNLFCETLSMLVGEIDGQRLPRLQLPQCLPKDVGGVRAGRECGEAHSLSTMLLLLSQWNLLDCTYPFCP